MPRILYVDDEPALLEVAKVFLEQDGQMYVDIHTSAAKAIPLAASGTYDAVISDYQMPGMDGIQFLKTVRGAGNTIPFILFTGRGREEIAIQALNEGADFYIQKGGDPVSQFAELANKVRYAVGRKEAEAALRASEENYRRFVETSIEGIWSMDAELTTGFVNPKMADMLGYAVTEMLGKKITEFMDPGELADNAKKLEERRTGKNGFYERKFRRKDGSIRWFQVSATALKDTGGIYAGSFAMLTDITDRKLAEEELKRKNEEIGAAYEELTASEEELRQNMEELTERERVLRKTAEELENQNRLISTILDTTPIGIFMVEVPSGKPITANPEAIRLLGRGILPDATEDNLSEVYEAYRAGTGQRYPPQEMPVIRGMKGETSRIDDMEVVRPDGTRVRLEIFGNPVRDYQGKIIASLVTFLDITGRIKG